MDKKLTQEELNALSPRARKAYEDSNTMLSEITIENPNAEKKDKPKSLDKETEATLKSAVEEFTASFD